MEALVEKELIRSIGLGNGNVLMLIEILAGAKIKPVINQIENHPYFSQKELVSFFQKIGVSITAFAPIGSPMRTGNNLLEDEVLSEITVKHNATPAQIVLAWNLSRSVVVIPKSITKERIKLNIESQNIKLEDDDIERINSLNGDKRGFSPEKHNLCGQLFPYFR